MSTIKISQLPTYTGSVAGTYFVIDNPTLTETYKVLRENIVGSSGSSGTSGFNGVNGTSGSSGTSGSDGTSGTSGVAGTSGSSGSSGTSGSSGSSGTSGSAGTSGSSGVSGVIAINNPATGRFLFTNAAGTAATGSANLVASGNAINISGSVNIQGLPIGRGNGYISTNIGFGSNTLGLNSVGNNNLAFGANALAQNTSGSFNTAIGGGTLSSNTTANNNTAVGANALAANTTGQGNVAIGTAAAQQNKSGGSNIAIGNDAQYNIGVGDSNLSLGGGSLFSNVSGSRNIAFGIDAGRFETGSFNFYLAGHSTTGTLNGDRSGSLMWGTFSNTIANQTLQINASTRITGSLSVSAGITGSLQGSSSFASNALSSSYAFNATTASFALNAGNRDGLITTGSISTSQSITGSLNISGSLNIVAGTVSTSPSLLTVTSNTASIDLSQSTQFQLDALPSGSTHFNFVNVEPGLSGNILIRVFATSSLVTFSSNVKQMSGGSYSPSLSTFAADMLSYTTFQVNASNNVYLAALKNFPSL